MRYSIDDKGTICTEDSNKVERNNKMSLSKFLTK